MRLPVEMISRKNNYPAQPLAPFAGIQANALRQDLADGVGTLPERERLVLVLYFDEELSLKEIGLIVGFGESRVS